MFEEELTPEEKIWVVLKAIDDAVTISFNSDLVFIDARKLEKSLLRSEHEQIFKNLEKDYKVLKIDEIPDYTLNDTFLYKIRITNQDDFRKLINEIHNKYFSRIDRLSGDNFLAIVDVSKDIMDSLQMTTADEVKIPLLPSLARFPTLMPQDSINLRDRYCDLRWKAVNYLKNNGHIEYFEIEETGLHRWEHEITIFLNRLKMDKFYTVLIKTYEKRVVEPVKSAEEKNKLLKITEITKQEKSQKEDLLFPATKDTQWKNITIKFKNDFDVDVMIGKNTYPSDYEKMKFADKRIKKPEEKAKTNDSWKFLLLLSATNGVFPLDKLTGKEKEQKKKQKQSLSKNLVDLFPTIEDKDPFYEYDDIRKNYKIKINLIPVKIFRNDFRDKDIKDDSDDKLGIKNYFDEITGKQ